MLNQFIKKNTLNKKIPEINFANIKNNQKRISLIDIGSNSIRLVTFNKINRIPKTIYSEKVFCGLARNLNIDGYISKKLFKKSLKVIQRFYKLSQDIKTSRLIVFATAAIREAKNRDIFIKQIEKIINQDLVVLSETHEATLSSLGLISSFPNATGIMADLGGGSLEFSLIQNGKIKEITSIKVGSVRLLEELKNGSENMVEKITKKIEKISWLKKYKSQTFYCVGGSFRSLAKLLMWSRSYPLQIVQGYTIKNNDILFLINLSLQVTEKTIKQIPDIEQERSKTIPVSGIILKCIHKIIKPSKIVFCSQGLREGCIYSLLTSEAKKVDPLIYGTKRFSKNFSNSFFDGKLVFKWLAPLFKNENLNFKRLRLAFCYLSELSYWNNFKDFQSEHALHTILYYPFLSIVHEQRIFLSLAMFIACGGKINNPAINKFKKLLSNDAISAAAVLGYSIKLSYLVSGGLYQNLNYHKLLILDNRLVLQGSKKKILKSSVKIKTSLKKIAKHLKIKKVSIEKN